MQIVPHRRPPMQDVCSEDEYRATISWFDAPTPRVDLEMEQVKLLQDNPPVTSEPGFLKQCPKHAQYLRLDKRLKEMKTNQLAYNHRRTMP